MNKVVFNSGHNLAIQTHGNRVEISHDSLDLVIKTTALEKAVIVLIC